jgi:hypothetical protein
VIARQVGVCLPLQGVQEVAIWRIMVPFQSMQKFSTPHLNQKNKSWVWYCTPVTSAVTGILPIQGDLSKMSDSIFKITRANRARTDRESPVVEHEDRHSDLSIAKKQNKTIYFSLLELHFASLCTLLTASLHYITPPTHRILVVKYLATCGSILIHNSHK